MSLRTIGKKNWKKIPWQIRLAVLNKFPKHFLRNLNILVTSKCNLNCEFCNIGRKSLMSSNNGEALNIKNLNENMFLGKMYKNIAQVHLSGGEPFLRRDLIEICDLVARHCPNAGLSIATNGTLTDRILDFCAMLSYRPYRDRMGMGISLDGIGTRHDNIRGVDGVYSRVMESISKLKAHFPGVLKSIGFTIVPGNIKDLQPVFEIAKNNGLSFYCRIAAESAIYYGDNRECLIPWKASDFSDLDRIVQSLFAKEEVESNHNIFHAVFSRYMVSANRLKKRNYPCFSGLCSVFIDHEGNIRPCIYLDCVLGNIAKDSLEAAISSQKAKEIRRYISRGECFCWTECETMNSWSIAQWLGMPIFEYLKAYQKN